MLVSVSLNFLRSHCVPLSGGIIKFHDRKVTSEENFNCESFKSPAALNITAGMVVHSKPVEQVARVINLISHF